MTFFKNKKFTTTYSINTLSFRGPQSWQNLPQDVKNSDSLNLFKFNVKIKFNVSLQVV